MKLVKWEAAALALCLAIGTLLASAQAQNGNNAGQYRSASDAAEAATASLAAFDDYIDFNSYESGSPDGYESSVDFSGSEGGLGRGLLSRPGQFFFGATYIYARANFSEALAYVEQDSVAGADTFHMYDFNYNSSYSFDGGYRLLDCDAEIRFNFTRLRSEADFNVADGANTMLSAPYEIEAPTNGNLLGDVDVDLRSYDIGISKTIPLGSSIGCGDCVDPCVDPCGDSCDSGWCPAWDITWSAGLRYANLDWSRGATAFDVGAIFVESATTRMQFEGTGARVGLEGRRYIGRRGLFSLYAQGDISLLLGRVDIETQNFGTAGPGGTIQASFKNVIPVTEIEVGGTMHVRDHTSLSAGYFLSAWHDLGMRDDYRFSSPQLSGYDTANILSFNGFFARAEVAY